MRRLRRLSLTCSREHFRVSKTLCNRALLIESTQKFIARKGRKTYLKFVKSCFCHPKALVFFFSLVPQLLFPFLPTNLISCFKHVSPWRRTVLPAAICLSPKHSCGSWHFKNTPWQLVFKTDHFFYFHFLPFPLSQGAEACSQK